MDTGLAGNYMQIMTVLEPIAFDVLECLSQLFDYYLYAVGIFLCNLMFVSHIMSIIFCCRFTMSLHGTCYRSV